MKRSENMRRIKSKNTKPELAVRRMIHATGYRYRLHYKKLPGKPDLVFPGRKKVIFVHGCFWHQHLNCKRSHYPQTRREYWKPKLENNIDRDQRNQAQIRALGWDILIVWECETEAMENLKSKILSFLRE